MGFRGPKGTSCSSTVSQRSVPNDVPVTFFVAESLRLRVAEVGYDVVNQNGRGAPGDRRIAATIEERDPERVVAVS